MFYLFQMSGNIRNRGLEETAILLLKHNVLDVMPTTEHLSVVPVSYQVFQKVLLTKFF
jgi:hypothetical protein